MAMNSMVTITHYSASHSELATPRSGLTLPRLALTGVFLAKHYIRHPELVQRPSFETKTVMTNVASVEANRRYVETDMNRCFLLKDLQDPKLDTLEHKRAREIDAELGPKSSPDPKADIVFDLHNTTANSGFLLLMAPEARFLTVAHRGQFPYTLTLQKTERPKSTAACIFAG